MTDPIDDPKVIAPEDIDPVAFAGLTLMRRLVTVLLGVMILGFLVLIGLLVTRFPTSTPSAPSQIGFGWPSGVTLPDGANAVSFTRGIDWFGVVTEQDEILIFDVDSGDLRQTIVIE